MKRLLIVGCGDIAWRALPHLRRCYRVLALLRDPERAGRWRSAGATPLLADLDDPATLGRIAGVADLVLHLAPPADRGPHDHRTAALLAALASGKSLPQRLIYVSTSGVYGDCAGALIDETRPCNPQTARAIRRVDAEEQLRAFGKRTGVAVATLRVPGIYAADRLPLVRLRNGTPVLCDEEDVFTNHIHADDLARACVAAIARAQAGRVYHVSDDSQLKMGEYFDRVADAFSIARPPRVSRAQAERVLSPVQLSFMRESRRLSNRRLKEELGVRLLFPDIDSGIRAALQQHNERIPDSCS